MRTLLFPSIAVLAALVVGALFILLIGGNPIETYVLLMGSAVVADGIGYTLFLATPLIFTGLAVAERVSSRSAQYRRRGAVVSRGICHGVGRD